MKILITGINGQVGHALMRELTEHELIGLTRQDCDLANLDQIKNVIDQHQPDLIINPAAYTKVDQAEDEPELAFLINRAAPKVMAEKAVNTISHSFTSRPTTCLMGRRTGLMRKIIPPIR